MDFIGYYDFLIYIYCLAVCIFSGRHKLYIINLVAKTKFKPAAQKGECDIPLDPSNTLRAL